MKAIQEGAGREEGGIQCDEILMHTKVSCKNRIINLIVAAMLSSPQDRAMCLENRK